MSRNRFADSSLAILACLGTLLSAQPVLACSVCYGDPNSAMAQGAQAGVLVLLGVVGTVLVGVASLLVFWVHRAANLENQGRAAEGSSGVYPPTTHHSRSGA